MVRPRNQPIVHTAEKQLKRLRENYSRRELIQLLGVAGAGAIAGCGGGGQEAPAATETATRTATSSDEETEAEDTPTPETGRDLEAANLVFRDLTTGNYEKLNPNPWNAETGSRIYLQQSRLAWVPNTIPAGNTVESAMDAVFLMLADSIELTPQNNLLTINLRDDVTWGDGTPFDAENVLMHADVMGAQIELGEQSETLLPLSFATPDEHTVEAQLLPGNGIIRMMTALYQGTFVYVSNTHPKLHKKFLEQIRDATTTNAKQNAIQNLFSAKFSPDRLPAMAIGPFKATNWNPEKIEFEGREEWPWGLNYHPDQPRFWKGATSTSVTDEQLQNAEVAGKRDFSQFANKDVFQRFDQNRYRLFESIQPLSSGLVFSPKSHFGQKTEKSRRLRQAVAFAFDSEEMAQVNNLIPAYEPTTGHSLERYFKTWIGEDTFESWTNYGKGDTGYSFPEKGYEKLREAGFERNKNDTWVDSADGSVLSVEFIGSPFPADGITRPVIENAVEQINRHGIEATGQILEGDTFGTRAAETYEFDIAMISSATENTVHPYFGYREDVGLGSREGLPAGVWWGDWRNGYRRVQVPFPVGNPDGELKTYDWDKSALGMTEITSQKRMQNRVRELSWVANQWVPAYFTNVIPAYHAVNTERVYIPDDYEENETAFDRGLDYDFIIQSGFWQPSR